MTTEYLERWRINSCIQTQKPVLVTVKYAMNLDVVNKELIVVLKENFEVVDSKLFLRTYESFIKQFNTLDYSLIIDCSSLTLDYAEFLEAYQYIRQIVYLPTTGNMFALALISNNLFN